MAFDPLTAQGVEETPVPPAPTGWDEEGRPIREFSSNIPTVTIRPTEQKKFDPTTATPVDTSVYSEDTVRAGIDAADQYMSETQNAWENIAKSRFSQEQIDEWKNKPIGVSESLKFVGLEDVLPFGGLAKGAEALRIAQLAEKQAKEPLSDGESEILNKYIDKTVEQQIRGYTLGADVIRGFSQAPAFMVEYGLAASSLGTAAAPAIASTAAKVGATKLAQKAAITAATKALTLKAASLGATALASRYVPKYGERRVNDAMAITDKGEAILKQSEESPAKSALMALGHTAIEFGSEASGGVVMKGLAPVAKPFVAAFEKLPANTKTALFEAYKKITPNATMKKLFSKGGWHGFLGEMSEERVQQILDETLDLADGKKHTFDDYINRITPSARQLLTEAGVIGTLGGVQLSGSYLLNHLESKGYFKPQAEEILNNLSAREKEAYADKLINKGLMNAEDFSNFLFDKYGVEVNLVERESDLYLASLKVMEGERGAGLAKKALKEISEYADKKHKDINLTPTEHFGSDINKLKKLYKKFGFIENEDGSMTRPKNEFEIDNSESIWANMYRYWVNDIQPIEKITALYEKIKGKLPDGMNPNLLARQAQNTKSRVLYNILKNTFYINDEGNSVVTGEGLKPILDDFDMEFSRVEKDHNVREQDFSDYLIAMRYLEDLKKREDVLITPEQEKKSIDDLMRLSQKYGDGFQRFEHYGNRIYDFQKRIFENLVRSGLMSQEDADKIFENNKHYVRFKRVFDDFELEDNFVLSSRVKMNGQGSVVKEIKGSERDLRNVFPYIMQNTAKIIQAAERNRIAKSIANMESVLPQYIQKVEEGDSANRNTILYKEGGQKKRVEVSRPLWEAMQDLHPNQISMFQKFFAPFRVAANVFRTAATITPEFWLMHNLPRDINTARVQAKGNFGFVDAVAGIAASVGKTDLYHEWMRNGGGFDSFMELNDKKAELAWEELMRPNGRFMRYAKSLGLEALKDASSTFEEATRVGVYRAAKRSGMSDLSAAIDSRDATIDFLRAGKAGRIANRYIPFLNAGIQGTDKLVRAFKDNPALMTFRGITTITVPSVLLTGYYLYGAPEDERKEYLEQSQVLKDMAWTFKAGGEWRTIYKPFSLGYLFGTLPERFMLWAYKEDKPEAENLWRDYVMGLGGSISPIQDIGSLLTPVGRMAIESLTNYNFFTGRPIYSPYKEGLPPEERTNKYTSQTATQIGKTLGVSPALVENSIRNVFASSTPYVLKGGDALLNSVKKWNGEDVPEKPITDADRLLIRGVSARNPSGFNAISTQNFMNKFKDISQIHEAYTQKKGEEKRMYREQHTEDLRLYNGVKNYDKRIREIKKHIDKIYDNKEMSSEEKVQSIRSYEDQILEAARQANKWLSEQNKD